MGLTKALLGGSGCGAEQGNAPVLAAPPGTTASDARSYTVPGFIPALADFPADCQIRLVGIEWIEAFFDYIIFAGETFFDASTHGIRWILDGLELLLVQSPWIVIFIILVTLTGLSAGPRAAVWTGAFLAYTGVVGLWEMAMTSLALLGTAACISISIGIPLGMYCARRPRVY